MRGFLLLMLPLAACGGGTDIGSDTTNDPVALNVVEAAAEGTPAAVAAAADCGNLPKFVPVYAGAQVTQCISGPDGRAPRHISGSVVYLTDVKPEAVLGWSRSHANASGLAFRESGPNKVSAGEELKRSVLVVAEPHQGRTRVTVNWGGGA
jgi:hypothetical protein